MTGVLASSTDSSAPIMPGGMTIPREYPKLLAELQHRRIRSLETDAPINQSEIAEKMGVTPGHVSRLERGQRHIRNLTGFQVYVFLRGYGFTPSEIEGMVTAFGWNFPPQLTAGAVAPVGTVMVLHEGNVSRPGDPEPKPVQEEFLRGANPERVRSRDVSPYDLATARAQELVHPGTLLLYNPSARPKGGSIVILEAGKLQALAVWPLLEATYATPYAAGGQNPPVLLDPNAVTLIGVAIGGYREYPH